MKKYPLPVVHASGLKRNLAPVAPPPASLSASDRHRLFLDLAAQHLGDFPPAAAAWLATRKEFLQATGYVTDRDTYIVPRPAGHPAYPIPDGIAPGDCDHLWFAKRSENRPDHFSITSGSYKGGIAFLYRDPFGHVVGAQFVSEEVAALRLAGADLVGRSKYYNYSHGDEIAYRNDNDEAPLQCFIPRGDRAELPPIVDIVEGGPKAISTGTRSGRITIGGNGGRFGKVTLLQYADDITRLHFGGQRPRFQIAPDIDDKQAVGAWKAYRALSSHGYKVEFLRWDKQYNGPDDALRAGATLDAMHPLEWLAELDDATRRDIDKADDTGGETRGLRPTAGTLAAAAAPPAATEYREDAKGEFANRHNAWAAALGSDRIILDRSGTGSGKTFAASNLPAALDLFDVTGVVYLNNDYWNLDKNLFGDTITGESVAPLEDNAAGRSTAPWTRLNGRHSGKTEDDTGDFRTAAYGDDQAIPANCVMPDLFAEARRKGFSAGEQVCGGCPVLHACKSGADKNGPRYKFERKSAAAAPAILGSIQTVTAPDVEGKLLIIDEASLVLATEKITVDRADLADLKHYLDTRARTGGPVTADDCSAITALMEKLAALLTDPLKQRYGLNSGEAVAILAPYAEGITEATLQRIEATEPDTSFLDTTTPTIAAKRAELERSVKNWLPDFVRILQGKQAGGLQLQRDRLTITQAPRHVRELIEAAAKVVLMDATGDVDRLTAALGLEQAPAVVRQAGGPGQQPIITQIIGVSKCTPGQPRTDNTKAKIKAIRQALNKTHGGKVAVIEYTKFVEPGDHRQFVHDRGRNDMGGAEVLIVIGAPIRNLGSLTADSAAITGRQPDTRQQIIRTNLGVLADGTQMSYGHTSYVDKELAAWIAADVDDNCRQIIGRLRANRHTNTPKYVYFITDNPLGIDNMTLAWDWQITKTASPAKRDTARATAAKEAASKSTPAKLAAAEQRLIAAGTVINATTLARAAGLKWRQPATDYLRANTCMDRTSLIYKRDTVHTPICPVADLVPMASTATLQATEATDVTAEAIPGERLRTAAASLTDDSAHDLYEIAGRLPRDPQPEDIEKADTYAIEAVTGARLPDTITTTATTADGRYIPPYPLPSWTPVYPCPVNRDHGLNDAFEAYAANGPEFLPIDKVGFFAARCRVHKAADLVLAD
jgi:hypothetical protein